MYENHPVFLDHVNNPTNRKYQERVGHISKVKIKGDGLYGDLVLNPHHTLAESLWWDFTNNTTKIGLSHMVEADVSGNKVVKITEVRSVDIVNNPATCLSLREEEEEVKGAEAAPGEGEDEEQEEKQEHDEMEQFAEDLAATKAEIEEIKGMIGQLKVEYADHLNSMHKVVSEEPKSEKAEESVKRRPIAIAPQGAMPKQESITEFVNRLKRKK